MIGMIAARQLCRNTSTTSGTRIRASNSVSSTASIEASIYSVGLYGIRYSRPRGKLFAASANSARTASAVDSALEPGSWVIAIATVGRPDRNALTL